MTICCTCGAGKYELLPAWLASIVQVPAALNVTTPFDPIEQILVLDESIVIVTGSPELAVACGRYVEPTGELDGAG